MSPRYPLIFNPSARSQRGRRTLRFLMTHAQSFVLYASRSAEDAKELAAKLAAEGEPIVVAAGGDGTLNAVVVRHVVIEEHQLELVGLELLPTDFAVPALSDVELQMGHSLQLRN